MLQTDEPQKMPEAAPVKISKAKTKARATAREISRVRVSPGGYVNVLLFLTFAAGFLAHLGRFWSALILLAAAWTILPVLLYFDRIEFDGKSLRRAGFVAFARRLFGEPRRLKIADIERVETGSLRTFRSGGRIFYRYRSEIIGEEQSFVFASGGKNYRAMVRRLFPLVPEEKLDARSLELRDFLIEPDELDRKISEANLPSSDVLENTLPKMRSAPRLDNPAPVENSAEKSGELRRLANELRVAGNLAQAMEAFRRALNLQPDNAETLHEFARGLYFYAHAANSETWERRATAALRLATKRAANSNLLSRIGESQFQFGRSAEAAKTFRRALDGETENFRAEIGLAEIGLQDGKIAHVVHHFQSAVRAGRDAAAKNWARAEADYFQLLNSNEEYMDLEIARINWLGSVARGRRICFRLAIGGLLTIAAGAFFDPTVAAIGWAVSAAVLLLWAGLSVAEQFLDGRFPPLEDEEEEK